MKETNEIPIADPEATLEQQELSEKIKKLKLEQDKLQLERIVLLRTTSRQTLFLEWLKAATGPAAIIGIITSIYLGVSQLSHGNRQLLETQQQRDAERFDSAVSRLASEHPLQRLTGIAGLRLFLDEKQKRWHSAALRFLATAISNEPEPAVRQAINDTFTVLDTKVVDQTAILQALQTVVEFNKNLTIRLLNTQITHDNEKISPLDIKEVPKFGHNNIEILNSLKDSVMILVGKSTDLSGFNFSHVYCRGCDFRKGPRTLINVNFSRALLQGAVFSGALLREASFADAELGEVNFYGADLSGADLHISEHAPMHVWNSIVASARPFPYLECANLSSTNLSRRPLISFREVHQNEFEVGKFGVYKYRIMAARMKNAVFDSQTKMSPATLLLASYVPYSIKDKKIRLGGPFFLGSSNNQTEQLTYGKSYGELIAGAGVPFVGISGPTTPTPYLRGRFEFYEHYPASGYSKFSLAGPARVDIEYRPGKGGGMAFLYTVDVGEERRSPFQWGSFSAQGLWSEPRALLATYLDDEGLTRAALPQGLLDARDKLKSGTDLPTYQGCDMASAMDTERSVYRNEY